MISIFKGIKTVILLFLILGCNNVKNNSEVKQKKLDTIKDNNTEDFFTSWIVNSYDEEIVIISIANEVDPNILKNIISDYLTKSSNVDDEKKDYEIIIQELSQIYSIEKKEIAKLILDFKRFYNEK